MSKFARFLAVGLLGSAALACGPSKSTAALYKANGAIRRAEASNAQKKRPYELALAREYYVKAKEEAGYSKYEVAEKLANKSEAYARVAAGEKPPPPPDEGMDDDEDDR